MYELLNFDNYSHSVFCLCDMIILFTPQLASQGQQKEDSVGHRKKWDAFQQEYNYGQEMLSQSWIFIYD